MVVTVIVPLLENLLNHTHFSKAQAPPPEIPFSLPDSSFCAHSSRTRGLEVSTNF